ncbi:MAG: hypothetical protein KBD15_03605, partial [Candidatus Magasanikbacteria bacterium]|nr:hypothetical protein [Candidatus Magasanikbacteria bacterium]
MRFFSTRFIATLSLLFCLSLVILGLFGVISSASAQQVGGDVFGVAVIDETTQLGSDDIRVTIAKIINGVLMFLGTIAFVLVIYGGFVYMTAGGNEEKISQAKRILINATIGLAIILSA